FHLQSSCLSCCEFCSESFPLQNRLVCVNRTSHHTASRQSSALNLPRAQVIPDTLRAKLPPLRTEGDAGSAIGCRARQSVVVSTVRPAQRARFLKHRLPYETSIRRRNRRQEPHHIIRLPVCPFATLPRN